MQMTREQRLEERGVQRGMRRVLKRVLTTKFGPLPDSVLQSIDEIDSTERLDELIGIAVDAVTLDELKLGE